MTRTTTLDQITDYLSLLSKKIEIVNSNGEFSINIQAENILINVLNIVYDCDLKNANYFKRNYPAVDLIDIQKKVAFQVTSSSSNDKIIHTLQLASKKLVESGIKEINIYILTKKAIPSVYLKNEYKYKKIVGGHFHFNVEENIIDMSSIYKKLNELNDLEKMDRVLSVLEKEFKDSISVSNRTSYKTYVLFDDADTDFATQVILGLIDRNITVYISNYELNNQLKNQPGCDLVHYFEGDIPTDVHYITTIITQTFILNRGLSNNNVISLEELQSSGKLVFPYFVDIAWNEYEVTNLDHSPLFFQKSQHSQLTIDSANRIKSYEDGIEVEDDIMTLLKHYRPNDKFMKIASERIVRKGIGFELYAQTLPGESKDKIVEYFLYLKAQGERFNINVTADRVSAHVKDISNNRLTLLIPKAKHLKHPERRKDTILKKYKNGDCRFYFVDEFAWQNCNTSQFRNSHENSNTYLSIDNFVQPLLKICKGGNSTNDSIQVEEIINWFSVKDNPIHIFIGIGGIGKTTLARNYADLFLKRNNNVSVLFIESENIIRRLQQLGGDERIIELYDFYSADNERNGSGSEILSKEIFQIHFDNGKILIVIDGIDEVMTKVPSFNISNFIESIRSYTGKNGFGKIIFTCRSYFWMNDQSMTNDLFAVEIHPFDEEKASEFFNKKYPRFPNYLKKCLSLAKQFSLKKDGQFEFIPFILDVVSEIVEDSMDSELVNNEPQSPEIRYLKPDNNIDFFISQICNRETIRSKQIEIESQLEFFIRFSVFEGAAVQVKAMHDIFDNMNVNISDSQLELFKSHPLLDVKGDVASFRYDFFDKYFKALFISDFLKIENNEKIDSKILKILLECNYSKGISLEISNRGLQLTDEIILRISDVIKDIYQFEDKEITSVMKDKSIGGLVSLSLTLLHKKGDRSINANTYLLQQLFENPASNRLNGVVLYNLVDDSGKAIKFDFENLIMTNSRIDGYEDFWLCKFNEKTVFDNCSFRNLPIKSTTKITAKRNNFINPTEWDQSLENAFDLDANKTKSIDDKVIQLLRKFLKIFYSGGQFKMRVLDLVVKSEFNKMDIKIITFKDFVDILMKCDIIEKVNSSSTSDCVQIHSNVKQEVNKFIQEGTLKLPLKKAVAEVIMFVSKT